MATYRTPSSAAAETYIDRSGTRREKLMLLNFNRWRSDCATVLLNEGLLKYVHPDEPEIETPTAAEANDMKRALNLIWFSMSGTEQRYYWRFLGRINDPRRVWKQIKAVYEHERTAAEMIFRNETPSSWRT
jgi:hypothetical protein